MRDAGSLPRPEIAAGARSRDRSDPAPARRGPSGPSRPRRERGVVVFWFALFMMTMLGFVALGVDLAKLLGARTQLQNAADAAALAGASAIHPEAGVLDRAVAVARAQETAARNRAYIDTPAPVELSAGDVTFPGRNRVRVTVRREGPTSVVTHVAGALGLARLAVSATATAQAETARVIDCGLVPLGVTPPPGQHAFQMGCGKSYQLGPPGAAGGKGSYGAVAFPECKYGECHDEPPNALATWQCLMQHNYCCSIERHQEVATLKVPNLATVVRHAVDGRFDADTDRRENICYDQYAGNGKRVVFTPITLSQAGGPASVTVTGFAAFFIQGRVKTANGSALVGQFIHAVTPGHAASGPSVSGPVTFSVRLVE